MTKYDCKCCSFTTELKSNYTRHLKTKKHQKCIQSYPKCYPKLSKNISSSQSSNKYVCKYCVVCSPCVLLVEYVCKYCVNMCVNTVDRCVALHKTKVKRLSFASISRNSN